MFAVSGCAESFAGEVDVEATWRRPDALGGGDASWRGLLRGSAVEFGGAYAGAC